MSAYSSRSGSGGGETCPAFAAVIFLVLGIFNIVDGIAALANDDYFHVDELLFGDLSMWGTIFLVVGVVQLLTGFLIFRGSFFGSLLGIALAAVLINRRLPN